MKNKGLHMHRLQKSRGNPDEVKFAAAWEEKNERGAVLAYLLQPGSQSGRPPDPSDRDVTVAATVVQWLGSPVGQAFLQELGFVKQCTSKSGPIQCEHIKGHKNGSHGADVGTGYAQWGKGV